MNEEQVRQIIQEELQKLFQGEGLREQIRREGGAFFKSDRVTFYKLLQILDGRNIQLGKGTGTKVGTETTQKLGFFNKTPVVQQAAMTAVNASTVDTIYGSQEQDVINNTRTRVSEIETALEALGLIASN